MKDLLFTILVLIWIAEDGFAYRHKSNLRLKVRSTAFDTEAHNAFIDIPGSTEDPEIHRYEKVELEDTFIYHLDLYCIWGDPKFCLFYDRKGRLAGIQLSYPKKDVANVDPWIYNFSNPNYIETCFYGTPSYSVRIYLKNPSKLPENSDDCDEETREELTDETVNNIERKENRKSRLPEDFEGLWAVLDGKLVRYDSEFQPDSTAIDANGGFEMQGCTPRLGLSFVRGFNEKSTCRNGFFLCLLYEDGALVAFAHFAPGKLSPGPGKDMFDDPKGPSVDEILPNPPPCFEEMRQYGLTAINIHLIDDPWNIRCRKCHCDSL